VGSEHSLDFTEFAHEFLKTIPLLVLTILERYSARSGVEFNGFSTESVTIHPNPGEELSL
jgi:hypothetical protein